MRILYLSYWGLDDGLTRATVFPHLKVLQGSPRVDRVVFVTVERGPAGRFAPDFEASRIRHVDLHASRLRPSMLARAWDFVVLPRALATLCRDHAVTRILARSAPAGALAHLLQRHARRPYMVESFEPHSAYMLESGVWSRWDPRYLFQRRWEAAQKRGAEFLLPVSEAYRRALLAEGSSPDRVVTLPCTVDTVRFRFSEDARRSRRAGLGIGEGDVLGVYVGKFGGTYYGQEAFRIFLHFARAFRGFRLLVLSPTDREEVDRLAAAEGFETERLVAAHVPHAEIPEYLSAADIAFATVRPIPSRRYGSLVKVGEYWASGLPVVITEGMGEDSDVVREQRAGATLSLSPTAMDSAVEQVRAVLAEKGHRLRIARLAQEFRSRERVAEAYSRVGLL